LVGNYVLSDIQPNTKRTEKNSKKSFKKTKKNLDAEDNMFYILQNVKVILISPAQNRKKLALVIRTMQTTGEMIKVPAKLYRIGDIVRYTPFSRQTIHNYTTMGLIREAEWTQGGHRLYDESVFERLSKIMEMKKTKSLFEIRKILSMEESSVQPKATGQPIDN